MKKTPNVLTKNGRIAPARVSMSLILAIIMNQGISSVKYGIIMVVSKTKKIRFAATARYFVIPYPIIVENTADERVTVPEMTRLLK